MSAGNTEKPSEPARVPRAKLRLVSLADLDGRTHAAKAAIELKDRLLAERGGIEALGAIKVVMAESVAALTAMITDAQARWLRGESINCAELATLINARRREAEAIQIDPERLESVPTLQEYLKSKGYTDEGATA